MTDSDEAGRTNGWMNRRTMLKNAAAAGLAGVGLTGTASAAEWTEMTLCASGSETFSYRVEVSGALKRGGTYQSDSWDEVGDDYADGAVSQERCDSFLFQGEITDRELEGPGQLKVDGEVVEDATGGSDGADGGGNLPKMVTISSPDTDEQMNYVIEVTGDFEKLEPNEDGGAAVDLVSQSGDRVRVEGTVGKGNDKFAFSGDLIEVDIPSGVVVEVTDR